MGSGENSRIQIQESDHVEITTIIDNYSESTLPMTEPPSDMIKRFPLAVDGKIPAESLMAEHGLCLLIKVFKDGINYSVLLDAGWSKIGVPHNIKKLGVDMSQVEAVVLSHGHMDHFGALPEVLDMVGSREISVIIHPDAFMSRALALPTGDKIQMPVIDELSIQKTNAKIIKTKSPYSLAAGLIFSLGEIERTTDFELGMPNALINRGGEFEPDSIVDDHGIVLNIKGKGLIVITGCAHSGVINTIKHAQKITGVDKIYVVMGGFHLTGPQYQDLTDRTVAELLQINPTVIIPMHCNSWWAIKQIATVLPEQFKLNSVGTTFCF